MKIIKKPKIKPICCYTCGCIFKPGVRDMHPNRINFIKNECRCPVCNTPNLVDFENERLEDTK